MAKRRAKIFKLCAYCKKNPVNFDKSKYCSMSCSSLDRWHSASFEEKKKIITQRRNFALRHQQSIRLQKEIKTKCEELGLPYDDNHKKLYCYARNRGYHNGYYTMYKKARKSRWVQ